MKRGITTILILAALILLIAPSQEYLFTTDATSQETGRAITIRPAKVVTVSIPDIVDTPAEIEEEMYYDSLEMLAICVEAEAGNQSMEGKRLVAAVILNCWMIFLSVLKMTRWELLQIFTMAPNLFWLESEQIYLLKPGFR